jgi:hypothetical protein
MFDQRPEQIASSGPVPAWGRSTDSAPVTVMRDQGMTLTVRSSAVAPAVSLSVCVAFAGRFAVEPLRAEETAIPGLASAAEGRASRAIAAAARASGLRIAQLDHNGQRSYSATIGSPDEARRLRRGLGGCPYFLDTPSPYTLPAVNRYPL